ncbi:MAG: hypothetical protein A2X46_16145 [Lentisphaerae bacterium GWF2_57_35]|nr:MAG: hypothetical protein A2X46_16145 [Lentisphaerae bacterium GWF2_57_35]
MNNGRKCSHAGFWVALVFLGGGLLLSLAMNAGLMAALLGKKTSAGFTGNAEDEYPQMTEKWSYGEGKVKAARIGFTGVITRNVERDIFGFSFDQVESVLRQIRAAKNDSDVKAIVFEVDSPGGEITPSDEIYQALLEFKASDENRKVIVFVTGMAASGGYYMSAAGDWILAEPTSIIGSIGVIMESINFKGLSEKIGITDVTIKSSENKDLLNPFREVSPVHVAILQATVDAFYQRFFNIVQNSRPIDEDKLIDMADGRIFSAEVALETRFIDEIGYWDDVVSRTHAVLEEDQVKFIRYEQATSFFDRLSQARAPLSPMSLLKPATPRFLYQWRP